MRAFLASLRTETNSFVARATTLADFRGHAFVPPGNGPVDADAHRGYATLLECAREAGLDLVRGSAAAATPGGVVAPDAYAELRRALLSELAAAAPVDVVFLDLHGAMAAEAEPDCEGDILAAARAIAGPDAKIGALLDPHAALSARMVERADILIAYKHYPHTDIAERARELFVLTLAAKRGEVRPIAAVAPAYALGGFATTRSPMREFIASLHADEAAPDILSVSLIHGFPWADSADNGAKALVYADNDAERARALAENIAARFTAIRELAVQDYLTPDGAIERVRAAPHKRFLIADACDNPGGGADGDSTHLLAPLWRAGLSGLGAALINDAAALSACLSAGLGSTLTLSLGGKLSTFSGRPLVLTGRVAGMVERVAPPPHAAPGAPLGPIVRFATECGDILISGQRREALWPNLFTETGAALDDYRIIVVKSSNHFRAGFEGVADDILSVGTPTAMNPDLGALPFKHLPRPMWPLDRARGPAI